MAVLETLAPAPDVRAIKFYAPGVGLIAEEEGPGFDLMDPELTLELIGTATPVPLPAPFVLLSGALAGLFACSRRACAGPNFHPPSGSIALPTQGFFWRERTQAPVAVAGSEPGARGA